MAPSIEVGSLASNGDTVVKLLTAKWPNPGDLHRCVRIFSSEMKDATPSATTHLREDWGFAPAMEAKTIWVRKDSDGEVSRDFPYLPVCNT